MSWLPCCLCGASCTDVNRSVAMVHFLSIGCGKSKSKSKSRQHHVAVIKIMYYLAGAEG